MREPDTPSQMVERACGFAFNAIVQLEGETRDVFVGLAGEPFEERLDRAVLATFITGGCCEELALIHRR
ncbi:MAG: hypothetical protein ABI867_18545 [Kofleriaceae bacterium]